MLCGHGPCSEEDMDQARQQIDEAMADRPAGILEPVKLNTTER